MKRKFASIFQLMTVFALLISACGSSTPPNNGVFIVNGSSYIELEKMKGIAGLPNNFNQRSLVKAPTNQPTIILWSPDITLRYLQFFSISVSRERVEKELNFKAAPKDNGLVEVTFAQSLQDGKYCFVQGDPLGIELPYWCFQVGSVASSGGSTQIASSSQTPSPNFTSTSRAVATATSAPTSTPMPTLTYTPSTTPTPSDTPTPSKTPTVTFTPTPAITLPFKDTFDKGIRPEWKVMQGEPITVNGQLRAATDFVALDIGAGTLENYTVEFEFSGNTCCFDPIWGVIIADKTRYHSGNNGYGKWQSSSNNKEWKDIAPITHLGNANGKLRLVVSSNTYQIFINDKPFSEITYGSATRGSFGLLLYKSNFAIDNLTITSP